MLEEFRVGSLANVYYIPEYITSEEEERLIERLRSCKIPWTEVTSKLHPACLQTVASLLPNTEPLVFEQVSGRRLKNYGGRLHDKSSALLQAPLPG